MFCGTSVQLALFEGIGNSVRKSSRKIIHYTYRVKEWSTYSFVYHHPPTHS